MRRRIILEGGVKTEKVTVQVTMSDGASAQGITVTINGSATTTNADGVAYGEVPYDTNYNVVFSQKDSTYSTPATQSFTANQSDRTVNATYTKYYETCTVTSNISTTITINGNKKTNTTTHSVSIPYGTTYTVSISSKSGYTTPSSKSFTANASSRSVTMNYTTNYNFSYYVGDGGCGLFIKLNKPLTTLDSVNLGSWFEYTYESGESSSQFPGNQDNCNLVFKGSNKGFIFPAWQACFNNFSGEGPVSYYLENSYNRTISGNTFTCVLPSWTRIADYLGGYSYYLSEADCGIP